MRDPPGRKLRPGPERLFSPLSRLVGVARIARVGDLERFRLLRWNKPEGVTAKIDVGDRLLDFWHVTTDALLPG